ncbi:Hypothetical protein CAP_0153 [Chondromyces apiculatus DSM 436]|uniref:Uncharacterized protein n=1 Tax=Chondromyces apiculatus DSM 436 TaxID=1192034 RepID=A0A017TF00_9BACT|nr:Hypothetical protein CAP_0153 [Chondromyces apiculatus DSM 436]
MVASAALFGACANGGQALPGGGENTNPICLLNNCATDLECGACGQRKRSCLVEEGRCVACDPDLGVGCAEGEVCSRFGACVASGAECPADERGQPLITCLNDMDCAACDPLHQVCDPETSMCVACLPGNTQACQTTESCVSGMCRAACPAACTEDSECGGCLSGEHAATVCNAGRCAECSETVPCATGQGCTPQGICVSLCGTDGSGACSDGVECAGCFEGETGFVCHGGAGVCGPDAMGCGELGTTAAALPEPWDAVVKACTTGADCAGLNVKLELGQMLRELSGVQEVGDADYGYAMKSCASVTVSEASCGVCVPCQVDADCAPIDADVVGAQLFGEPESVEASLLADRVFGASPHLVYMFCETSGPGYGVCSVCPGFMNDCRGSGGAGCAHDVCEEGEALTVGCDPCAEAVCAADSYCCTTEWDALCMDLVAEECPEVGACEGGAMDCAHDECEEGPEEMPLASGCSPCVDAVCAQDAFCCQSDWDDLCVEKVDLYCDEPCP